MDHLLLLAEAIGALATVGSVVLVVLRELRKLRDGMKCQLRNDMLHIYYRHREENSLRQYEYENFIASYEAYKALKGNSFIDKIYKEVQTWEVLS